MTIINKSMTFKKDQIMSKTPIFVCFRKAMHDEIDVHHQN